jgi:hypothetical protein
MAETGTDDARARAAYIRLRVAQIIDAERIEMARAERERDTERTRLAEVEKLREIERQRAPTMFLRHEFRQGICANCGAVEARVREFRTTCLRGGAN